MTSVNNINFSGDNYGNTNAQNSNPDEEKTLISVFNYNKDNVLSIEEQKAAYDIKIDEFYNKFKGFLSYTDFKIDEFKNKIFAEITKDYNLNDDLEKKSAEYFLQKGINEANKKLLDIVDKELEREQKAILNDIELGIYIKLLNFDTTKDQVDALLEDFNHYMDSENEEHIERFNKLKGHINTRFPEEKEKPVE